MTHQLLATKISLSSQKAALFNEVHVLFWVPVKVKVILNFSSESCSKVCTQKAALKVGKGVSIWTQSIFHRTICWFLNFDLFIMEFITSLSLFSQKFLIRKLLQERVFQSGPSQSPTGPSAGI